MFVLWILIISLLRGSYKQFCCYRHTDDDIEVQAMNSQDAEFPVFCRRIDFEKITWNDYLKRQGEADTSCMICLDDFEENDILRVLPCLHAIHEPCIIQWLYTQHTTIGTTSIKCPICRKTVMRD